MLKEGEVQVRQKHTKKGLFRGKKKDGRHESTAVSICVNNYAYFNITATYLINCT